MSRQKTALNILAAALTAVLIQSCVNDSPANLEPGIRLLQASGITRTEATLSAIAEWAGTGRTGEFTFSYGTSEEVGTPISDNYFTDNDTIYAIIGGLTPGTTYYYRCECRNPGTGATVVSDIRKFSTVPNDRPTIAGVKAMSSGPVGLIVGFDITDDGGERILSAGCDVTNAASGANVRLLLPEDQLTPGEKQIYAGGMTTGQSYIITPFAANTSGESEGEPILFTARNSISLLEPGLLETLAGKIPASGEITISGMMNGGDFLFLRHMLGANESSAPTGTPGADQSVNLADVRIMAGGPAYDGSHFTEDNVLGTGILSGCSGLRRIELPTSAVKIMRNALIGCRRLETLTVPACVTELLPSDSCMSLKSITVQEANKTYRSFDGVLFNHAGTEIVWVPMNKEGNLTIPATLTALRENAFRESKLTSITLPEGLASIGRGAFSSSALKSLDVPPLITNIPEGMAQDCRAMTDVKLGKETTFIGSYSFTGCPLENFYIEAVFPPVVQDNAFDDKIAERCVLHVPAGSAALYRNHDKWKNFKKIIEK